MKNILSGRMLFLVCVILTVVAIVYFYFVPSTYIVNSPSVDAVKIHYADNISPAHRIIIDRFNALHKGSIEVVPIDLPFSKFSTNERKELLARALRSKNSKLDLFAVDLIWVPRFAKWAEPFPRHFAQNRNIAFLESALESCFYQDELVALPLYTDIGMMYFQRELVRTLLPDAEALSTRLMQSITWEELIAIGDKLQSKARPVYLYAGDNFEGLVCSFMELILSQDSEFFEETPVQLNTPESRKALQLLIDLIHEYEMTPETVTEFDEYQTNVFALENDGLFWRSWPGLLVQFQNMPAFRDKLDDIAIGAVPHFAGGQPVSIFGGWNLMISNHSKHKKEALAFLLFFLTEQSQITMYEQGGYLPVSKNVYMDSTFISTHPEMSHYYRLLKNGVHRPYREDYTKWSDVISYYVHQAIKKKISAEAALNTATEIINSKKVLVR